MNTILSAGQILVAALFAVGGLKNVGGVQPDVVERLAKMGAGKYFRPIVAALQLAAAVGLFSTRLSALLAIATLCIGGLLVARLLNNRPEPRPCPAPTATCCDAIGVANRYCYRAQCYATARGLATRLGLAADGHSVAFQSRLGRTPWIKPYTDVLLDELARRGVKRLAVLCPAFVADCLETLEEIGIRAREQFRAAGGEELTLVPCVNAAPAWADAVAAMARAHAAE